MKHIVSLSLSVLMAIAAVSAAQPSTASKVETGSIDDAAFRIEIPASWNKSLVLFAHGYTQPTAAVWDGAGYQQTRDIFLSRGFAYAESAYSEKAYTVKSPQGFFEGYAVKAGFEDTEALRRRFVSMHGKPERTYIVGQSLGAIVTVALVERYPNEYDGALPMCGPLVSATEFFNYGLLDVLVTFDYYFPNVIGSPFMATVSPNAVRAALEAAPERAAMFANRVQRSVARLPSVIAYYQRIAAELVQRAGGNPFDNANRVYKGYGDDVGLNRGVKRYRADPKGRDYLRQYYSPTGRVSHPVLTIAALGDELVLPEFVAGYEIQAAQQGTADLFAAHFVDGQGHCGFATKQIADSFDELVRWDREGKRPPAGELK